MFNNSSHRTTFELPHYGLSSRGEAPSFITPLLLNGEEAQLSPPYQQAYCPPLPLLCFVTSLVPLRLPQFQPPQPDASSHSLQAACDADIASFYIYDLPDRFDRDLIRSCRSLSPTKNMCPTSPTAASASRSRTAPTGSRRTPNAVCQQGKRELDRQLPAPPSGARQRVDPHHRAVRAGGQESIRHPHPSYFHPRSADELTAWQEEVRRTERTHLFAFVGGARTGGQQEVMRALVLEQCGSSSRCLLLDCKGGSKDCRTPGSLLNCKRGSKDCRTPGRVMDVLMRAEFCLQPQGDTFTRRSVFDSVLAGCVPVFFSEHTAYTQYPWYLPGRAEEWSVFLGPERRGRIEEELSRIPKDAVARMREVVIGMIPRFTFAHPNASWAEGRRFRDTVDVALAALTKRVRDALSESENNSTRPK
uniref:Exostosin GT47 domain-containing protein n=1 Tax=Ananas comosus var. bracteatus TaxID=296719 RepID=A0A6V7QYC0_ANACO